MFGLPLLPRTLAASERDVTSTRPEVRASAIADLVRHTKADAAVRKETLVALVARLEDDVPGVRAAAAVALGDLVAEEAMTALLLAVEDDDAYVRQMAINALGEIRDPRALPRLRRAISDDRPEVRYQAVIAFERVAESESEIDDVLVQATRDDDHAIAHIALRVAEERIDRGKKPSDALRSRAHALLAGPSPDVALVAAIVLAKAGDDRGHELILDVVRGVKPRPDKEDECAAVELVGALGLTKAIPALERRTYGLTRFVRDTCRFHARIALARMGHARATDEILSDLGSARREVRAAAIASAGRARLESARERIARLPNDAADPDLVREALAHFEAHG